MSAPQSAPMSICGKTQIIVKRKIPPGAHVRVAKGDVVRAADAIATASIPGEVHSLAAAELLGVSKSKLVSCLFVREGDDVSAGQVIGRRRGLFGLLNSVLTSPMIGTVESVSGISGHMMIRETPKTVTVTAYVNGEVVNVDPGRGIDIAADVSMVQGAFGVGDEATAMLCSAEETEVAGKIVVAFDSVSLEQTAKWRESGALGIVAASMNGDDLYRFCGPSLNLAATGDEDAGVTLMLTEGFGHLPMARNTKRILGACIGKEVSMCGITQVRAGVIRPELIGPVVEIGDDIIDDIVNDNSGNSNIVKIVRGRYLGQEAVILDAPAEPMKLASGVQSLVYKVRLLDTNEEVLVPRPNVA